MADDLSPKHPNEESFFSDLADIEFELDPAIDLETSPAQDPGLIEMQETFLDMIRHTLNPIARYMKAMQQGEDTKEIFEISELVVTPLIPKVEATGLISHAEDLTFFRSLLLLAVGETDPHAKAKMKEIVYEGFVLVRKKFDLRCRGYKMAVRNLIELYRALASTDVLTPQDTRKIFAIGIPSLSWFRKMKASELCELSGVSIEKILKVKDIASHNLNAMRFAAAEWARDTNPTPIKEAIALEPVPFDMQPDPLDTETF